MSGAWEKCERCGTLVVLVSGAGLDGWWERLGATEVGGDVLIEHTPDRCSTARAASPAAGTPRG